MKLFTSRLHVVKADSEKMLVEMLSDGRAEFAITSMVPTKDLLDSVVFVGPVWRIRLGNLFLPFKSKKKVFAPSCPNKVLVLN